MFARVATAPAAPLAPPNSHAPDDHRPRGNTSADDTPTLGDGTSLSHLLPSNSSTLLSREEPSSFISNVSAFDHGVMQLPPKTPSATSSYSSAPPPNIPATQPTSTASTNTLNTNPAASSPGTTENASLLFRDDSTAADVHHLHDVGGPQHAGTTTTLRSAEVPIIQPVDAPPHTRQTSLQQQWSAWRQHVAIPATAPTTASSSPPAPLVGTPLTAPSTTAPAFTLRDVVPLAPKPRQQDTPRLSGTSDSSTYDSPLRTSNTQTNSARADTPPRSILRRPGSVPHSARSSRRISFASSRSPNDRHHVDSSDDDDDYDDDDDDDERFNEPMLSYASDDASSPPHRPSTELLAANTAGDSPAIAHEGWADMNDNTPTPEKMPRDSGHHYALDDDNDDGAYEFEGTDVHTQPHVGYPSSSPVPLPPKPNNNNNNSSQPQPHHHHHHHSRKHSQQRESSSSTPPRSSTSSATPARRSTDHSRSPAPSSGSQAQRVACVCRRSTSQSSSRRSSASPARGSCSPQRPSDERLPRRKPQPEASTTPNMLLVENKEVADDVATQPHHQPEKMSMNEPTQRRRRRQRDAIPPSRNTTTNNSNSEVMRTSVHDVDAAEETMASARGDDHRQRRRRRSRSSRGRSSSISGEASLREQRASFVQQQQQHASASLEHSSTTKDEVPRKKLVDEGTQAHAEATEVVKVANARTQTSAISTNTTFTSTPQRASASASTQVSLLQPTQVEAATSSSGIISPRKRLALVVRRRNTDPRADNSIVRMKLLPVAESIRLRALIANVANNNNNKKHDSRRDGSSTPVIDLPRRSSSRRSRRRSGDSKRSISSRRASQTSSPHRRRSSRSRSNSPQQPMTMVNEKDHAHQHHHHLHRSSTRSPRSSRSSTSASRQPSADAATAPRTTPTTASSTPANDVAASAQVLTMNADVVAAAQPRDKTDEARKHRRSSSSTSAPRQHNNNNNVPEEQPKPKHRRQKKNASASSPVPDASSSSTKTHMLAELPPMDGDELDLLCSIAYQRKMLQHKKKQPQPRTLKQRDDGGGDDEAGKKIRTPRDGEGGAAKDEAKKHKHRRHKTSSSPPTTKTTTSANAPAASTDAPVVRSSSVERRRGDDVVVQRRLLSPDKRALDVDAISETVREWRSSMSFNASPTTTTSATRVDPRSSARRDRIWSSGGGVGATTTAPRWSTSSYAYGDDDDDDVLPRARQASTKWSDYVKDAARVRHSDANFGRYTRDDDASTTYSRYTYRSERNLNNNTYNYNTSRKSSISTFADRYADDVWRHKFENERGNTRRGGAAPPPPPPPPLYSDVDDVRSRGTSPDMDGGTKLFMHDDELVSTPPARGASSKSAQMKQRTIIDVSTSEDFARRVHGIAEALELYHDDVV